MENFHKPGNIKIIGNPSVDWIKWKNSFETFLVATGLETAPDRRKIAILMNLIGEDALDLMNNFSFTPATDKDVYAVVLEKFDEYCLPKKNLTVERFNFHNICQKEGEPFESFLTELKSKAAKCEFGDQKNSLIRDRIVCGIRDKALQKRLLRDNNITMDDAVELCIAAETSERQARALQDLHVVDIIRKPKTSGFVRNKEATQEIDCGRCGTKHRVRACPAYGKICHLCKGRNHFSVKCKFRSENSNKSFINNKNVNFKPKSNVNNKNVKEIASNEENCNLSDTFLVTSVEKLDSNFIINNIEMSKNAWYTDIKVANRTVKFKLDTGAEVNIIPRSVSDRLLLENSNIKLQKSDITLVGYGNYKTKAIGKINLTCKTNNKQFNLDFVVTNVESQPLLGLDACTKLELIKKVNIVNRGLNKNDIFRDYSNIFSGLGLIQGEYHIVVNPEITPVMNPPRRIPLSLQSKLKETLKKLEDQDVITKVEYHTDWVNNLVIVEKKTGELRLCLDPKDLNQAIIREHYIIPTAEEIASKLNNKKIFSVIDMSSGFWQIKLDKASADLCTFNTPFGKYKFLRLPFGIKSAPEVFQKFTTNIFGNIEGVQVVFDDLIISGTTEQEHDEIFKKVLDTAKRHNITFNKEKLQFKVKSVKFMGHIVSEEGLRPDEDKIKSIVDMKPPTNKDELRKVLGMVNYFSKFLPNLSEINAPLRKLLKEDVLFTWNMEQKKSYKALKDCLIKAPVLKYFDPKEPITLQADASQNGLGACLMQNQHPIGFVSRALTECERRYAQIEKELLAIVFGMEKFHHFVYGQKVEIHSDHKPLEVIMTKEIHKITSRLQRMMLRLLKYDYVVTHVPGKKMFVADVLSRFYLQDPVEDDVELELVVHSIAKHLAVSQEKQNKIKEETSKDESLKEILRYIKQGWPKNKQGVSELAKPYWKFQSEITESDGLIFKGERLLIPVTLRKEILNQIHAGHQGIEKCKIRARSVVYWLGINQDIEEIVRKCAICEKYQKKNQKEKLLSHPVPNRPWKKIATDVLEFGGKNFLVVIDYYSNWLEIVQLSTKTANEIIVKFKEIFARNGIPEEIVSDNMPYNSNAFHEFGKTWDIKLTTTSPRFPQANGMAERGVQIAKTMLRKAFELQTDIYEMLMEYRNTLIKSIGVSPAQAMLSRTIRTKLPIQDKFLIPKVSKEIKQKKEEDHRRAETYFNRHAKDLRPFEPGEDIMIKKGRTWHSGRVISKHNTPRSYIVDTPDGVYRRNRRDLKPSLNSYINIDAEIENLNKPNNETDDSIPIQLPSTSITPTTSINDIPSTPIEDRPSTSIEDRPCTRIYDRPVRNKQQPIKFKDYVF